MTDPLVSVKMITYNHAPYIAQAIEGVLNQKVNFPIELVIGEDCSTDATREIISDYQNKYPEIIRVITSERNVGLKQNSYRTTKACRGKYIAFCEGDDYWHDPDKLQRQVEYLETNPECGLVFTDFDIFYNKTNKVKKSVNYCQGFQLPANLNVEQVVVQRPLIRTCTVVVRRSLYEQVIESDPYLHKSETFLMGDTQLWTELALISKVSYIPNSMATYRFLDESASRSKNSKKDLRFWKSAHQMKLYLCDKHKLSENIRREEEAAWCDIALRLAFNERNSDLAMQVRKKKANLTFAESLRYFGAKYSVVYYICRAAVLIRNSLTRESD